MGRKIIKLNPRSFILFILLCSTRYNCHIREEATRTFIRSSLLSYRFHCNLLGDLSILEAKQVFDTHVRLLRDVYNRRGVLSVSGVIFYPKFIFSRHYLQMYMIIVQNITMSNLCLKAFGLSSLISKNNPLQGYLKHKLYANNI